MLILFLSTWESPRILSVFGGIRMKIPYKLNEWLTSTLSFGQETASRGHCRVSLRGIHNCQIEERLGFYELYAAILNVVV